MISIVQNFICTQPDRLDVIERNMPKLKSTLGDCPFIVNFNDTVNLDKIQDLYNEYIPNLSFENNMDRRWAEVTLDLVKRVETPYVAYLCEDQEVNVDREFMWNSFNEAFDELGVQYYMLTRIGKYISPRYRKKYVKQKYGYTYKCNEAPHKRLSLDAIYETKWFMELLEEFIKNQNNIGHHIPFNQKNLPNFYEGYYDFQNGTSRFKDMMCYIPKKVVVLEYDESKQKHAYI